MPLARGAPAPAVPLAPPKGPLPPPPPPPLLAGGAAPRLGVAEGVLEVEGRGGAEGCGGAAAHTGSAHTSPA